jgi:hypothetical protein
MYNAVNSEVVRLAPIEVYPVLFEVLEACKALALYITNNYRIGSSHSLLVSQKKNKPKNYFASF